MNASQLTAAQHRALAVLVAAHRGREMAGRERRPVRTSNRTSKPTEFTHREMLTVHHTIADQLAAAGLVRVVNDVVGLLELTDTGRALTREAGL